MGMGDMTTTLFQELAAKKKREDREKDKQKNEAGLASYSSNANSSAFQYDEEGAHKQHPEEEQEVFGGDLVAAKWGKEVFVCGHKQINYTVIDY